MSKNANKGSSSDKNDFEKWLDHQDTTLDQAVEGKEEDESPVEKPSSNDNQNQGGGRRGAGR